MEARPYGKTGEKLPILSFGAQHIVDSQGCSEKDAIELMGSVQLGAHLNPEEIERIEIFLGTLTGNQPKVEYPVLPSNSDGILRPILK
jgi:hypothetical protein